MFEKCLFDAQFWVPGNNKLEWFWTNYSGIYQGSSRRHHSVYGLTEWATTLHCNVVSRWLIPYTEWPLSRFKHIVAWRPVFDFYAGPSARGRQLYCRACNFKKRVGPVGRQLLYLLCWAEWSTTVNGYWRNKILFKRYTFSYDPNQH